MADEANPGPRRVQVDAARLASLDPQFPGLLGYWKTRRGDRRMPCRADIDPLDLRAYLGNLLLLDMAEPIGESRYRLIGTQIAEVSGRDATNRSLNELYSEPIRGGLIGMYTAIVAARTPHAGWGRWQVGLDHLSVGALFLPLSEDGDRVTMVLAKMKFGRAPRGQDSEAINFGPLDPAIC